MTAAYNFNNPCNLAQSCNKWLKIGLARGLGVNFLQGGNKEALVCKELGALVWCSVHSGATVIKNKSIIAVLG